MVGIKDTKKLLSVVILTLCAVTVCTLFLNFRFDLIEAVNNLTDPKLIALYDAQITMSSAIIACVGGV